MFATILKVSAIALGYMIVFYLISQRLKKLSIVDIAWGGGFIVMALSSGMIVGWGPLRPLLVTGLVLIWGMRLMSHIGLRFRGKPEDFRYQAMKDRWGSRAKIFGFTHVFLLQWILMLLVGYPIILIHGHPGEALNLLDAVGVLVWLTGFLFEVIADIQLRRFVQQKKKSKDDIMTTGLWRYSRHPNYFGEALLWWGLFIIILSSHFGTTGFLGPIVITVLLLKVSGVPMLEKRYAGLSAYQEYAKKTSIFIPWPPKR